MRHWLVTAVVVLEFLLAAGLLITAVLLARAPDSDSSDYTAAAALGLLGLFAAFSSWSLWKARRWAWRLALVVDAVGLVAFLWDPVTRRARPDLDELAFIVMFGILVCCLLLPPVRRFQLGQRQASGN